MDKMEVTQNHGPDSFTGIVKVVITIGNKNIEHKLLFSGSVQQLLYMKEEYLTCKRIMTMSPKLQYFQRFL